MRMPSPMLFKAAICSAALISYSLPIDAASVAESSTETTAAPSYYKRHAEGWYWYQDPEQEIKAKASAPPPAPLPAAEPQQKKTEDAALPAASVRPLSAQWVRDMLPKYRDLMWSEPTPQNVKAYFLLQRFAIDRSQKVAEVAQSVTLGNPLLDETFRRPTASFGINAVDRSAGERTDQILRKVAEKAGLFFFFKSGCRFCEAEAPLIGMLEQTSGFDVLAISIDGGVLESYKFAHTRMNAGQAEELGVSAAPALFLVSADGHFESIGQGLMAFPELRRRILVAAARQGWIDDEDLQATKPIINPESQIDLSAELPKLLMAASNPAFAWGDSAASEAAANMPPDAAEKLADSSGFIPPQKLLALFSGASTGGQFDPRTLSASHENDQAQD